MSKYRVEACLQVNYGWLFLRKEGRSLLYHVMKVPKVLQNTDFKFVKGQVSKRT